MVLTRAAKLAAGRLQSIQGELSGLVDRERSRDLPWSEFMLAYTVQFFKLMIHQLTHNSHNSTIYRRKSEPFG